MGLMRLPSWVLWLVIVGGSAVSIYCFARGLGWQHPPIALGSIADWAAAGGAFFAALVALGIANRDRTLRAIEQDDEREATSKIQARLVQIEATNRNYSPTVNVEVVNFGQLPVLDVALVAAGWIEHPEARWGTNWRWSGRVDTLGPIEPLGQVDLRHRILHPRSDHDDPVALHRKTARFGICFAHPDRDAPILEAIESGGGQLPRYEQLDMELVIVTVHFTTADGLRWQVIVQRGVGGDPVRIQPRSRGDRWFARIGLGQ